MLQTFLKNYTVIYNTINTQDTLNIKKNLQKLQEKKTQLKTAETVLWINQWKNKQNLMHSHQYNVKYHYWKSLSFNYNHFLHYNSFRCLFCHKTHCIQNCEYFSVICKNVESKKLVDLIMIKSIIKSDKLIAVNLHYDKSEFKFKHKKKKHKVFNAEIKENSDSFSLKSNAEKDNKIIILFKKAVNKIFSSKWIADSEFSAYMTDQLWLSNSLIYIQCWWIKVEEKHLYFYYCEVTVMQNKSGNFVNLSSTFYVFKLEINLLLRKQMYKMKLHKSFNQYSFYMQNKHSRIMIKVFEQDDVYIVQHIAKNLNEFALLFIIYTLFNLKITFSATKLNTNSQIQICEFLIQTEFSSIINITFSNERIKIYKL